MGGPTANGAGVSLYKRDHRRSDRNIPGGVGSPVPGVEDQE